MSHHENFLNKLESNNKEEVEKVKQNVRDLYSKVQEPWITNGLYDYYLNTNSVRSMELMIALKEPHQQFLFDRLTDSIRNPKTEINGRVQALTLLGHIARSQPIWLYKLPDHQLFREILKYLMNEVELLPLISALLVLIVLLPIFPSSIGKRYLEDIFEIFRRLAAWNSHVPGKIVEDQMIHLQVALYALFIRLYGMFPRNFLSYLRRHFKDKNNPVFYHTIKPMMDTVKMHPSLVTTSKETETTTERWRKMGVHDVIVECERFSLDMTDRCPHETCQNTTEFRSRSGTMNSTVGGTNDSSYHQQNIRSLASLQMTGTEGAFFTPSQMFQVQSPPITESTAVSLRHIQGLSNRLNYRNQEGSPPEAAIEATPETTPVRDFTAQPVVSLAPKSTVVRAITSFRSTIVNPTPTNSVPNSPMRKEPSPFVFPSSGAIVEALKADQYPSKSSLVSVGQLKACRLKQERLQASETSQAPSQKPLPSSPLKILNSEAGTRQRVESPLSQEDEEVSLISSSARKKIINRHFDNSLPDIEGELNKDGDDLEHGSPCAAGGLHMPNSKSINDFKKRIRRFRFLSQCNPEPERIEMSTGSSPGNGVHFSSNSTVRRANSCPDIKKSPAPLKDSNRRPVYETDEETTVSEGHGSNASNGVDNIGKVKFPPVTASTQTEVFWPMPYEHLFLNIFPALKEDSLDIRPSPAPSPAPVLSQNIEQYKPSLYDILDKYIEKCVASSDNNSLRHQLQLVHQELLFERHRRETHAYRNRRLLSDAKSTRLLEEYNLALSDQVQLEEREIDDLRKQLEESRDKVSEELRRAAVSIQQLEVKCKELTEENVILKETNSKLESDASNSKMQCNTLDKVRQQAEAVLMDALAEGKIAKEQALVGEKVKKELERVNRELLLMGELHIKYKERLERLSSIKQQDEELRQLSEAYREEVKDLQHRVDSKSIAIEAYKARLAEFEHIVNTKDEIIASQKRTLAAANEEREAVLEAVESKYKTQLAINITLEEKILELRHKLETEAARRRIHSPDTSSCHEVQVTTAAGLSPHSSPLSASLASSEGSAAFQDRELRNLQSFVDQEGKESEEGQLGNSSKND